MGAMDSYLVDTLMRDLVRHDRAPSAFLVYLWLWSKTRGTGRNSFGVSLQTIATETGLSKSSVQNGLRRLRRRKLISIRHGGPTAAGIYEVLEPWKRNRQSA
jgi:transcription initiation factor IIE alpha subunit